MYGGVGFSRITVDRNGHHFTRGCINERGDMMSRTVNQFGQLEKAEITRMHGNRGGCMRRPQMQMDPFSQMMNNILNGGMMGRPNFGLGCRALQMGMMGNNLGLNNSPFAMNPVNINNLDLNQYAGMSAIDNSFMPEIKYGGFGGGAEISRRDDWLGDIGDISTGLKLGNTILEDAPKLFSGIQSLFNS